MKVLWWIALVVAVIGVLIHQGIIDINIINISSFWFEVIAAGLFAIAGLSKSK
jgi:hypothetical protein